MPFIPIEFQKAFERTRRPVIKIEASYQANDNDLFASKFGGHFYWPKNKALPRDSKNNPLFLLAQINFSQLSLNTKGEDTNLPDNGILQIFIPANHPEYGANFKAPVTASKIQSYYWPNNCDTPHHSLDALNDWINTDENALTPVFGAHYLQFSADWEMPGMETVELFEALGEHPLALLDDITLSEKEAEKFYDTIEETINNQGHKLLGYPYFTQTDPRTESAYQLLLQIDTDLAGDNDILWGDNGVGHLFIKQEALLAKDFSALWFHWDCL